MLGSVVVRYGAGLKIQEWSAGRAIILGVLQKKKISYRCHWLIVLFAKIPVFPYAIY